MEENKQEVVLDPLDMNNYKVEKLPKIEKSGFERWLMRLGAPLAIIAFIVTYYFVDISFLNNIDPESLAKTAAKRYEEVGVKDFIRINYAILAIFVAAIILWITEAVPNYLTSLMLILVWDETVLRWLGYTEDYFFNTFNLNTP